MRARRSAPAAAATVAVAGAVVAVVVASGASDAVPAAEAAILLTITTYVAVSLVIEHVHPNHPVARTMLLGATCWGVGEALLALGLHGLLHDPGSVPAPELLGVLGTAVRGFGWLVLILAVPLLFPDGHLPWPRRRAPAVVVVVAITSFAAALVLSPRPMEYRLEGIDSPTGLPVSWKPVTDVLAVSALAACVVALVVTVAGLAHRWRSGDELRRQQLLWSCAAFAVPALFLPLIGTDLVAPWMFAVVVAPVPVAMATAMLQQRLYDVQLVASRTLTWLALTGAVSLLYAITVAGVGAVLSQRGAPWLPWVGTGVVAVSFAPLHRLLQQGVNALTYGQWAEPAQVLAATGRRLVDATNVPGLLQSLVADLASGLGLDRVEVHAVSGRLLAAHGAGSSAVLDELPIVAYGTPMGVLRWSGPRIRVADRRLLEDLAHQLGAVVHAAGLLDTVREAQQQLVLAREEERRRLRRDLHDGLGPRLAGLGLQVDTLRNRLGLPDLDTDHELLHLRREIQSTVVDVRRIVEGLRPPALDELGLAGALEQLARRVDGPQLRVVVDVPPIEPLPAAVEVAVYRIVQEALTNAVRHSRARQATVRVRLEPSGVCVEVVDDGCGEVASRVGGIGLSSMRERAEQIGGRLHVDARPRSGTAVRAWLPAATLHDATPLDGAPVVAVEPAELPGDGARP